jgi:hypothetical protein
VKNYLPLSFAFLLACTTISMTDGFYSALLTEDDYKAQQQEATARGPALSAPLDGKTPYWESFNQWLCFPVEAVEITCLEAEYGRIVKVPALHIVYGAHYYEFSMDPDPEPDCEAVTRYWRTLLEGEREFCVYAAPLQEYEGVPSESGAKDGSVWIINRLKSGKGYWNFETEDNWLKDDEETTIEGSDGE